MLHLPVPLLAYVGCVNALSISLQDPEVKQIAESNGKTVAQTLLRWGLEHGTSVIPKSSNPKHIQASGIVVSGFLAVALNIL